MFNKHCQLMFNKCCQLMFNNYCQLMFHIVNLCLTTIVKLCVTIIVKFVKHNFTHRPFGVWVLLMWCPFKIMYLLITIPYFKGRPFDSNYVVSVLEFIYFLCLKGYMFFIYLWLHLIIYLGCLRTLGGDQATS